MDETESYSTAQRVAAWLGVAAAAGLLLICLDVASGGRLTGGRAARYRWGEATSSEETSGDD
jgi:hypothetical protein